MAPWHISRQRDDKPAGRPSNRTTQTFQRLLQVRNMAATFRFSRGFTSTKRSEISLGSAVRPATSARTGPLSALIGGRMPVQGVNDPRTIIWKRTFSRTNYEGDLTYLSMVSDAPDEGSYAHLSIFNDSRGTHCPRLPSVRRSIWSNFNWSHIAQPSGPPICRRTWWARSSPRAACWGTALCTVIVTRGGPVRCSSAFIQDKWPPAIGSR